MSCDEHLERVLDAIPIGVTIVDRDGFITFANEAATKIFDVKRSDIIGRNFSDFEWKIATKNGKRITHEEHPFVKLLQTGKPVYEFEHVHEYPEGIRRIMLANATPLYDGKGVLIGAVISHSDITERRRAEEALRESEEKFRSTFEQAAVGIAHVGLDGKFIRLNQRYADIVGYTKDELTRLTFQEITYPEDLEADLEQVRQLLEARINTYTMEKRYIRKDGSLVWVSLTVSLVRDEQRQPLYFIAVVQDITVQKQAAEEIRESRRQVLDILESITDGFFALDNDWRFTYLNRKAEQLLGKRKELLLFRNIWEALPDIVDTKSYEEFTRAKDKMIPISFEAFYPSLNRWLETHIYPYESGLSVYLSDITVRRGIEEELQESEKRYRSLVELSPDGIAVHIEGILVYVNPATVKMFGAMDASKLIGKPVFSFVHPDSKETAVARIKQMREGKTVGLIEEKFVRIDGSPIDVEVAASPIIYEGKPAIQVVFRDITERKRAEDTLKKSESRYHILFDESPASLWEEDASDVKAYIDSLSSRGVKNFRTYFESHPEDIAKLAAMIKIVDINKATLELYKARSKEEFKKNLSVFFGKESFDAFKEAIIVLAEGKTEFESETVNRTLTGEIINIVLKLFVAPGYEKTLSKLLVSIVDITERMREKELSDALNNINRTINSRLDFNEIMGCVVVEAAKVIGSERAGIVLSEDNFWVTRYGYNLPLEVFGSKLTEEEARATTLAAKTKTTVAVNDAYRDERVNRKVMERYGIRSLLAAPLVVRGNTIGVIAFSYHSAPVGFTESQIDFVSKLAATVSVAIDNARLIDDLRKRH